MSDLMKKAEEYATGPIELRSFLAGAREALGMAADVVNAARGEGHVDFRTLRDRIRSLLPPTK